MHPCRLRFLQLRLFVLFFFQAEDGIRDATVTGVQTCALPISRASPLPPIFQPFFSRAFAFAAAASNRFVKSSADNPSTSSVGIGNTANSTWRFQIGRAHV